MVVSKYNSVPLVGKVPERLRAAVGRRKRALRSGILKYGRGGKRRQFPWRELGRTPYEVLIAEVLLKRTTSTAAAGVYEDFLRRFPNAVALSQAGQAEISKMFTRIGLQRQRAAAAKKLAAHLVRAVEGEVPNDLDRLLLVPGVGDYTARAVLSVAFGTPAAVVDSNVERIIQRVFMRSMPPRAPLALLQHVADTLLPRQRHREFNLGILDLGGLICRPSLPRCSDCPLAEICDYNSMHASEYARRIPQVTKLGFRLRRIRASKGISLVRLARESKLSKLTIIRIEKGNTTPLRRTIKKLEDALGVSCLQKSRSC